MLCSVPTDVHSLRGTTPRVVVTAEVEDLAKWEKGFRTHGDLFKQMGVSTMEFGTAEGNRVAVCGETSDLEAYMMR